MTCRFALLPLLASGCYVDTPGLTLSVTRALDLERLDAAGDLVRVFVRPDEAPWTLRAARLATPAVTLAPCDPWRDTASALRSLVLPTAWAHEPVAADSALPTAWDLMSAGPFEHLDDLPVPPGRWCGVTLTFSAFPTLSLEGRTADAPITLRREGSWSTVQPFDAPLDTGRDAPAASLSVRIHNAYWLAALPPSIDDPFRLLPDHLEVSVAVASAPEPAWVR